MSTLPLFPGMELGTVADLSHGRENENSKKAYAAIKDAVPSMKKRILELAIARGKKGLTLKEACTEFKKFPHQISGRFSQLQDDNKIKQTEEERGNFGVWVAI